MIDTFSIRHYPRISWERISGLEVFAMSSGVISMLVHVRSTYCNLFILSSWCAIWRYLQTFLKTGNVCQQKVLSNPRRLISSFDVQFVLLAGSQNAVFCGRCCASNSRWLNRPVGELSPAHWGARKESKVSSQGLFSITHGEVFPCKHALSEAPRLTLGLILSSATKCYQAIVETLKPEHQPYHSKPLALTWTQLITKSTHLKLWAPLSLVPLQVDSEQVQFEPSISTKLAIDGNIRALAVSLGLRFRRFWRRLQRFAVRRPVSLQKLPGRSGLWCSLKHLKPTSQAPQYLQASSGLCTSPATWKALDVNTNTNWYRESSAFYKRQTVERSLPGTNPGDSNSQIGRNLIWPTIKVPSLLKRYWSRHLLFNSHAALLFGSRTWGLSTLRIKAELLHPGTCSTYLA